MPNGREKALILVFTIAIMMTVACAFLGGVNAQAISAELIGGWQPGPDTYHPSRLIVRFADSVMTTAAATDVVQSLGYSVCKVASFESSARFPSGFRVGIVELPQGESLSTAMATLETAPGVTYVEKDPVCYPDQASVMPNDTFFERLWALHNENLPREYIDPRMEGAPVDDADIDMPEAWELNTGTNEIVIAVIDTGCYIDHPDLVSSIWTNANEIPGNGIDDDGNGFVDDVHGWNFHGWNNSVWNPNERDMYGKLIDSHGTHVAGTIGAAANNTIGITGINWRIKIMPLKFLGPNGGYASDSILALEYAVNNGAALTNNSWGGGGYSQALRDAIEASGILFIAAAGNSGEDNDVTPHYPSSYDCSNVISVAASMQNDKPCDYPGWWGTCYGETSVDLFAPGGYIFSTVPPTSLPPPGEPGVETYAYYYGTSMATPHVSGVAALLIDKYPEMAYYPGSPGHTPGEITVKDAILGSVDRIPALEGKTLTGGRLNANRALSLMCPPVITSAVADPCEGPPPLEVHFSAAAYSFDGDMESVWWEFGDESEPVYDWTAVHIYEEEGVFEATFHVRNKSGLEDAATVVVDVFRPAAIGVEPTVLESALNWGEAETKTISISNAGEGSLHYRIDVEVDGWANEQQGGPDSHGYTWIDSDHPDGPQFEWVDISNVGTELHLKDSDDYVVDLPFDFPFYGDSKTSIRISSEGYFTFGTAGKTSSNTYIPNSKAPNDLIAVMWLNLNPERGGRMYYYGCDEYFIVQWNDVPVRNSTESYWFQAVLTPEGTMKLNYLSVQGVKHEKATIGIEDAYGTDGLQTAYNQQYLHDELTVVYVPMWISADPMEGSVEPGQTREVNVSFRGNHVPQGDWLAKLVIASNDKAHPQVEIDTVLHLNSLIPPAIVHMTANPSGGSVPLTVEFDAVAEDHDGIVESVVWDFGDNSQPVTGTLAPSHTYVSEGEYTVILTVTDDDGLSASREIAINARPLPRAHIDPPQVNETLRAHRSRTERLTIANTGDAELEFQIGSIRGGQSDEIQAEMDAEGSSFGGPDQFGYCWIDSDQPGGPEFEWTEISGIGNRLSTLKDDQSIVVELPWPFPFYGDMKTEVRISANGYLTFGEAGWGNRMNEGIPCTQLPNDVIAMWWDDLKPSEGPRGSGVYYYHDEVDDRFIVEYKQVPRVPSTGIPKSGDITAEVIFYPNGDIRFQYLDMDLSSYREEAEATIGIENADGTDGLEIYHNAFSLVHNSPTYIHDEMAILIQRHDWLTFDPINGSLAPGQSAEIDVCIDFSDVPVGTYEAQLVFETNDARRPLTLIPVRVEAMPNSAPVISACGVTPVRGPADTAFKFTAAATDADGEITDCYWIFGDGSPAVTGLVAEHCPCSR